MRLLHLITQEIRHRKGNAVLAAMGIAVAVAAMLTAVALLRVFDQQTEEEIATKEEALTAQMAEMEDAFRKITKGMGFNVLVLPASQNLGDFHAENFASATMPEAYADRLANAKDIVTIRHLMPMLQHKTDWSERQRKVLVNGVRGEAAWAYRNNLSPLTQPVPAGCIALGYELHRGLDLAEGDPVVFRGKTFSVSALTPERGTVDDITIWMPLADAQAMFGQEGKISAMTALECKCAWADLPKVRAEITGILPDTQVIELAGKALARAEARLAAEENARALIEREKIHRAGQRTQRANLLATMGPVLLLACTFWVGGLTWTNARARRQEIGILRALGLRGRDILTIFLGKATLLGLTGAAAGIAAAGLLTSVLTGTQATGLFNPAEVAIAVAFAPVTAVLASWLPALIISREDPAAALREE